VSPTGHPLGRTTYGEAAGETFAEHAYDYAMSGAYNPASTEPHAAAGPRPLADYECEHGRLPAEHGCECHKRTT
jgi:hypothetical protein